MSAGSAVTGLCLIVVKESRGLEDQCRLAILLTLPFNEQYKTQLLLGSLSITYFLLALGPSILAY